MTKIMSSLFHFIVSLERCQGIFFTPVVKDIAPINKTDIVMFLPQPESMGGTKRVAACLHFDVQLEKYNC